MWYSYVADRFCEQNRYKDDNELSLEVLPGLDVNISRPRNLNLQLRKCSPVILKVLYHRSGCKISF